MPRTAYKISSGTGQGAVGISLTDPGVTDACAATLSQFTDFDASCQVVSADVDVSQSVNREEIPGVYCSPTPASSVQSVTDEYTINMSVLLDEDQANGAAAFLMANSGSVGWVYVSGEGPDGAPKMVAKVRIVAAQIFGEPNSIRQATLAFPVDGKPAVCFGSGTNTTSVNPLPAAPDPNDVTTTIFGTTATAAGIANLTALKADAVHGDSGTGLPKVGGTAMTTGQYAGIGTNNATKVSWNGTAWSAGAAT